LYALAGKRVFVAGHRGMIGSAIVRSLAAEDCEILTAGRDTLDLRDQRAVRGWMESNRPQAVFMAAAKVGGIAANDRFPADFLYDNLVMAANLIEAAHAVDVEKLLFLGSSCIYPRLAPQPIAEDALLTGPLEPTNEAYAIAKIAGIKLARAYRRQHGRDFISAMLTNAYGPGDNFDPETSHVLPALLRKAHRERLEGTGRFEIWGTGEPRREFLHADDCADACLFLVKHYSGAEPINVGSGSDIRIADLARLICRIVGIDPQFVHDPARLDGTPQKLMDSARLRALGWRPRIGLEDGIRNLYAELTAPGGAFGQPVST
jgi:GDP-L-fucose synthase